MNLTLTTCSLITSLLFGESPAQSRHEHHAKKCNHVHVMNPRADLYKGCKVIELETKDNSQLKKIMESGARPLNCRINVGQAEFIVNASQIKIIKKMGLNFNVIVEDVENSIKENTRQREERKSRGSDYFSSYQTWPAIIQKLDQISSINPIITERFSIGLSYEGREIEAIRITSDTTEQKPAIILNGCQHAREWVSTMVPVYIAEQLVANYQIDPIVTNAINTFEIIIVPVANPDGYIYSYEVDRYWRKNRRNNSGSSCDGVDTNRNWTVDWAGPQSTSSNPCSDIFTGEAPLSEPENIAMDNLFSSYQTVAAHIDFHSYSQLILQPWAHKYDLPPDHDVLDALGEEMTQAISNETGEYYPHGNADLGGLIYLASGTMEDYSYGEYGALGYTIELRPDSGFGGGFELPESEILPTCQENYAAVKSMVSFGTTPLAENINIYCDPGKSCTFNLVGNPPFGENGQTNFEIQTLPTNGSLFLSNGSPISSVPYPVYSEENTLQYISNSTFKGDDSFSYVATFNGAQSSPAIVEVQVGIPSYPDDCISSELVQNGIIEFTTLEATNSSTPYDDSPCPNTYLGEMTQDIWFKYESCGNGPLTVSTCNTIDFDSDLVVYEGDNCESIIQIGCNGDGDGCAGYSSELTIDVLENNSYFIRVGGWSSGSSGTGTLEINGPPQENCQPNNCPSDLNADGIINVLDLLQLISDFGSTNSPSDINGDGLVNTFDLLEIVSSFGSC